MSLHQLSLSGVKPFLSRTVMITILLFSLVCHTHLSHAGPIDLAIDSIPTWGPEIIVIAAIYYAYNQNPQYKTTVQRLKNSLATNSTAKSIANWLLDLCIEFDSLILPSPISNIDKTGIKLAAQKVKNDLGLNGENCTGSDSSRSDPQSAKNLKPVNPGRNNNKDCKPCPPDETWSHPGNAHGSTGGTHYHGIIWNQNPSDCICHPKRVSGPTPDKLK
ncbi:hypothetical protein GTA51_20135 [Desulfovibrio aerotolerans]|uniref:Uncharacterized protein n=1 Tax=Solidesulfovibrio aerotolerans TaxID=295255 RepID=A0A7C9N341_9BACT|nr:hypothetical protein [Solidesulfovibrio aerotolerans]MYL85397.1 hypothetical protein [Solidesulfovibrio aerotolerans]